jgi:hypothetical protein
MIARCYSHKVMMVNGLLCLRHLMKQRRSIVTKIFSCGFKQGGCVSNLAKKTKPKRKKKKCVFLLGLSTTIENNINKK